MNSILVASAGTRITVFGRRANTPPIPRIGIARGSKDVGLGWWRILQFWRSAFPWEIIYKNERAAGEEYA